MAPPLTLVETRPTGHGRARGLVSSPTSGNRVEARRYEPPPGARDVVASLWSGRWDLPDEAPHVTELLSDPCMHFVFEQGGAHAGARLVGVWTKLWTRRLEGRGRVFGVKLRAGACSAFVGEPAARFRNRIVPLSTIVECDLRPESLPADDAGAFEAIAAWLDRIRRRDASPRLAIALVDRIVDDPEISSVQALAAASGYGARALQRIFREHVGASPKWVIQRHRLQEAALRIERGDHGSFASLAAELGYADQAHLAHDFKRVVGKPPSALAHDLRRG